MTQGEIEIEVGHRLISSSAILRDTIAVAKVEPDINALKERLDTGGSADSLIRIVPFPKAK